MVNAQPGQAGACAKCRRNAADAASGSGGQGVSPVGRGVYNQEMPAALFDEMKRYIGFGDEDAVHLRGLAKPIESALPAVVDHFYQQIYRHPGARAAITGGEEQIQRLKGTLLAWLRRLFSGVYDAEYCRERAQIGHMHVRINLPQRYMIAAMEVIWQDLSRAVRGLNVPEKREKLGALHKLLTIELALMLESYQERRSEQVRQVERDAIRARLSEAEQLAQIGQLAASLAHEIKNPLAGISGAIQVIRDNMRPSEPHYPVLGEVLRQINRLDRTVKDLLVYARPKPPRYQRCELPRTVDRVVTLLRKEPEFQRLRFDYVNERDLPAIEADEHQLEQLVMNLLLNAAQASPEGGLVRVSTAARDGGVQLMVEDRGCGMSPEVAARAMEPFYTTKARGTGLGLPICRKIVDAHGGQIAIRSSPGQGTAVTVQLRLKPAPVPQGLDDEDSGADR